MGHKYQISLIVKLTYSNGTEFFCDKNAHWGPDFCPLVSFGLHTEDDEFELANVRNRDATEWHSGFNDYHGIFSVNERMSKSFSAFFFIRGPRQDVDILFNDVLLEPYYPPSVTCDEVREISTSCYTSIM